ncbi:hypothetical protein MASR2M48_25220 [Spirochaetota bacterium]
MFKDRKPISVEEKLVASSGRCFYMPSNRSDLPKSDPFAERTILTRDDFFETLYMILAWSQVSAENTSWLVWNAPSVLAVSSLN